MDTTEILSRLRAYGRFSLREILSFRGAKSDHPEKQCELTLTAKCFRRYAALTVGNRNLLVTHPAESNDYGMWAGISDRTFYGLPILGKG